MFRIIFISLVGLLLACTNTKEINHKEEKVEYYDVIINATTTQAYCGGASPSEETLKELNTPSPAPNVKIYIRKGETNNIDNKIDYELLTDDYGRVEAKLPVGTYSIVFENKKDKSVYRELLEKYGKETSYQTAIDTNCLTNYFASPNAVLVVEEKGANSITVNKRLHCQWTRIPCSHYKGDLPPSAPPK